MLWKISKRQEQTTMRHLKSGSKLGRNPWHRRATLRNLVTNLFEHGRITTTLTRAKVWDPSILFPSHHHDGDLV